jgi:hypothetical protein
MRRQGSAPRADNLLAMTAAPGAALGGDLRGYFEPRLGGGLGAVRVHAGVPAVAAAGAKAVTIGRHIGFAPGRFAPETASGRALIGHELAHALQQARGGGGSRAAAEAEAERGGRVRMGQPIGAAFALEDYQNRHVADETIAQLSVTALQTDIDEISAFLDRQLAGTEETDHLIQTRARLQARMAALLRTAMTDPPRPRRPARGRRAAPAAPVDPLAAGPINIPRILAERRSMPTDDPAAVQEEVNRIVAWLQHPNVSADERQILRAELNTLAPQFEQARAQGAAERHSARVQAQFVNPQEPSQGLRHNIGVIEAIYNDPAEPLAAFIQTADGERLRISRVQAESLRATARRQMQQALARTQSDAEMAQENYSSMVALNREYRVISAISGWLGGVEDPRAAMAVSNGRLQQARREASAALAEGRLFAAIDPLITASNEAGRMRIAAQAFRDGHISGGESALAGLTFVRDAAFAIDGALLAVVAAPFVAGAVGVGGLGLTGAGATVLTVGGTGLVVGGTTATVGATTAYGGERLAGNSHQQALDSAWTEGRRRGAEGLAAGAGGATTRLVTAALPATESLALQLGGRFLAQGSGAFVGTTSSSLVMGNDLNTALWQGGRSALLSAPGVLAGAPFANGSFGQALAGAGTNAGVGYVDARSQGATHDEAMRGVALNLTTAFATSRAPGMQQLDARMQARGQAFGAPLGSQMRAGRLALQLNFGAMTPPVVGGNRAPIAIVGRPVPAADGDGQTMAGTTPPRPAPARAAGLARTPIPGEAAHDAWVADTVANGMGRRPPPLPRAGAPPLAVGDFRNGLRTMGEAVRAYDEFRARAPGREVGIYRNSATGEYAVVAGGPGSVGVPGALGNAIVWENIVHNHPNPDNVLTYRNPAPQDLSTNAYAVARRRGPVTTFIDHDAPGGGRQFTAVTQNIDDSVTIQYQRPDGQMATRRFASWNEFRADWSARTTYAEPGSSTYRDLMNSVPGALAQARADAAAASGQMQTSTGVAPPPPRVVVAPAGDAAAALPIATATAPRQLGPGPRPPLQLGPGPAGPEVFASLGRELGMTPGSPGTGTVWAVTPGGTALATPPRGMPIYAPDGVLPPASYFAGQPRTSTLSGPLQPGFTPFDVLPGAGATSRTLNQVRGTRGSNGRGAAAEQFVAESSPGSSREVTLALPGGQSRRSDVLSPTTPGIVNQEVKNYMRYRGAASGALEVELTPFMQTEINRDAMIMYYHRQQAVWVFTDAPPAPALRTALTAAGIPFVVSTDRLPVSP